MNTRSEWRLPVLLALLVVAAVLSVHVYGFGLESRLPDYLRNALHAPTFAFLAVVMQRLFCLRLTPVAAYLSAAGLALGIGGVGEILQTFGPRNADLGDLVIDGVGITAGLGLLASADPALGRRWRWLSGVAGITAAVAVVYPFAWYAQVFQERARALPVLLDFEADWERVLYSTPQGATPRRMAAPPGWPGHGAQVAELILDRPRSPGLKLFDPYPDWRGFARLSFAAAAVGPEPLTVVIRIHDDQHDYTGKDRFRRRIEIHPEPRRYVIELDDVRTAPEGREMNLGEIDAVMIYLAKPKGGERLLFDDLRLEPAPP